MNLARLYSQLIGTCEARNGKPSHPYTSQTKNRREGFEIHHITPRSTREHWFKNIHDSSNLVYMTPREHYTAHHILARLYGGGMGVAFFRMSQLNQGKNNRSSSFITSRQYETARMLSCQISKLIHQGNQYCIGRTLSPETKAKISNSLRGRKADPDAIKNRKKIINERYPIATCPHCSKNGGGPSFYYHHFDNCHVITGRKTSTDIVVCPHCGKTGLRSHTERFHFDNCRKLKKVPRPALSEELRKKLSEIALKRERKKCPYCEKVIAINNYGKYHGENCKHKPS